MDGHRMSTLLLIVIVIASTVCGEENTDDQICPEHQTAFDGSCYEFVTQKHSFLSAQQWCERGGGHLAFIQNDKTQTFLQTHLLPNENWWFGLAYTSFNQNSSKDSVSWLDGSRLSFSNWHNEPILGDGCAYIIQDSGFEWVTTSNCSQQFFFICEFDLGQSLACEDHSAVLKCGSGQVIMIDDGFYGRKTEHYCRANQFLEPTFVQQECGWLDILDSVSELCNGLQVCEVSANETSHGEPCPGLTSYLSLKYHCKEVFHSSSNDGHETSSQSMKALLRKTRDILSCDDLAKHCGNLNIDCGPNCDPVDPSKNLTLQLKANGWNNPVWYFETDPTTPGSEYIQSCKDPSKKMYVIKQPYNDVTITISNTTLSNKLNNHNEFKVIVKGTKQGKYSQYVGYGCQSIKWPGTTKAPTTTTVPSNCISQPGPPSCSIVLNNIPANVPFSISCTVPNNFCCVDPCTFCVKTTYGYFVYCGHQDGMQTLYLPTGSYGLTVTAMNRAKQQISDTVPLTVTDFNFPSIQSVFPLIQQTNLSVTVLAQLFQGISDQINITFKDNSPEKSQLVESMLTNLCAALTNGSSLSFVDEVEIISRATDNLLNQNITLTPAALNASMCILESSSSSQMSMTPSTQSITQTMIKTADPIVNAVSTVLAHVVNTDQQRSVFDNILNVLDNVHSSLLKNKQTDGVPALLNTPLIKMYANRLQTSDFNKPYEVKADNESAGFVLPTTISSILPKQVDLRMMSLNVNPYSWSNGEEITSAVASLSVNNFDGSIIPVKNLKNEIEVILPRINNNQNSTSESLSGTFMDLRNYSTLAINVTSPGTVLLFKLESLYDTQLVLHLGYEYHPNDSKYVDKVTLPQTGAPADEKYTWLVNSDSITNEGTYYLLVRPVVPAGVNSTNAAVFISSSSVNCKFWDVKKTNWSGSGCRVGPRTSSLVTHCLCTHLTFFGGSFFVMPNMVDVSKTAALFSTFSNNPVVVCFVGAIILVYILAVIWARRKDLQDRIKVKVTVLEDNDPLAEYRYLVAVSTGHRRGAATTSNVTLMLFGTVWESKPHHLTDPEKRVFTRGGVDLFLLTTPFSLGEIQSVRLWHDNSGDYPDWYVNKVVVQDLETGERWQFLCNSWLSIDMGECTLDKTFHIATEEVLKGFHNLFFTKTAKDLCDGHIWYSVLNRPANSSFTRVQRLSCCFSLLLCTMLTSIMFWGIPASPAEQDMELGSIKFNWQQIMVGFQSSIIMFPVNLLIVTIFRMTRPRKTNEPTMQVTTDSLRTKKKCTDSFLDLCVQKEVTMDMITKDLKRILRYLAKVVHCPTPTAALDSEPADIITLVFLLEDFVRQQNFGVGKFYIDDLQMDRFSMYRKFLYRQVLNLEKELKLLGPASFPKPEGYLTTLMQVQGMKRVLQPYLSVPDPIVTDGVDDDGSGKKKCCANGLPWWFVFVGWLLVFASSGVSAYFTMMYGLTYGKERSINWLISISVSFFESLFVTQPLKVLGFAVFFALVVKSINEEEINYYPLMKDMKLTYTDDPDDVRISRRDSTSIYYQPPALSEIEKMRINRIKNQKAFALIWEIIIYLAFLCVLLVATYGQRDPNAYFLTQHIETNFGNSVTDSMSVNDVFNWFNSSVVSNIFGERSGFITDGNSKLVGSARIRQVRVHKDSCRTPNPMNSPVPHCNAPYSWEVEDRSSYGTGWNQSVAVNMSQPFNVPWQYQSQSTLRGHPIWGSVGFYRGGGYVLDLGVDEHDARSMLQDLFENTWLDIYTRAIFVEFTVYNVNVNLFCIVTLMLETTAVGAFQYRTELHNLRLYQTTDGVDVVASEVFYFLFVAYYMFVQAKRMKQQKCSYFRSKINLLELAIILLSWSAAGAIINRTVQGDKDLKYFQENKDQFPSFYDTASADSILGYILAFLILLATVKMWHLLRLNSKLNLITCTLQRAWNDISSFLIVLTIMFLAYSLVTNVLFGWNLYTYKTLQDAAMAIVSLQLGIFNYDEILELNPVLGAFIIGSCIIFVTFVILNLFISVILEAFSQEQKQHQPSEEEEIVDLMMVKICKMFGIKIKKKQQ